MKRQFVYSFRIITVLLSVFASSCGPNTTDCKPSAKYLVVRPYAGLSNRLRVLASAKIMAALTDRYLVVDWSVVPDELPGTWQDFFLSPMTTYEQSPLAKEGCTLDMIHNAPENDPKIKNLGNANSSAGNAIVAEIPEFTEPIVFFGTSLSFRPDQKYISDKEYKSRYTTFYKDLDPHTWVRDAVQEFQKQHEFERYFMVGAHYRAWVTGTPDETQDVTTDREHRYLNDFVIKLKEAMHKPLAQTKNKPVAFFLASDDPTLKEKLLAIPEFKGRIFTRDIKIDRSTIHGQEDALVDWFLLGDTNYIIGTYQSTYSEEAAHLTEENRKIEFGKTAYNKP